MDKNTNVIDLELYIIRHGQTFGNLGKKMEGFSELDMMDAPLTPKGQRMAELLGERFKSYPFDAVYSSGLRRAMMTATEIIKRQPENGSHEIKILPLLSENGGKEEEYTGLTFAQEKEYFPFATLADGYTENDRMISFTSGWNDAQQLERAKKVISHIRAHHGNGEKVAITAHAAFNTFLCHAIMGLDPEAVIFDPHFLNTGVTKFYFFKEGTGRYGIDVVLAYLNDLSHLYNEFPEYSLDPCFF
ncbi:MAG: histidine phosphatase family protein [Clostridia bacterium]|nr:histidine phosphatase family protein [Clostridia bacterium]